MKPRILSQLILVALALSTSACTAPAMLFSSAATATTAVAQERPIGNAVDDASIRAELNHLFLQKDINDLFPNVSMDVVEGRVLLTGSVKSEKTKQEAARMAWKPRGVKEVINEIQVAGGTHAQNYAQDTWISGQVKGRMLLERNVRSINFNVETVNQIVYIIGIARDQDELQRVVTIASTTKYVKEVVSHILLQNDPRRGRNARAAAVQQGQAEYNPNDSYDAQRPGETVAGGVQPGSVGVRDLR
jgi:osmotically-inducible protein OsmY